MNNFSQVGLKNDNGSGKQKSASISPEYWNDIMGSYYDTKIKNHHSKWKNK